MALQKQQRVVDSLLHLVEDMSGRLKRLEESQPLASGPRLPAKTAAAELVERVKTLRSAMEKPMGGPAEAPYAPLRVDPGVLPFVLLFSESIMLGEHTALVGSMREEQATTVECGPVGPEPMGSGMREGLAPPAVHIPVVGSFTHRFPPEWPQPCLPALPMVRPCMVWCWISSSG